MNTLQKIIAGLVTASTLYMSNEAGNVAYAKARTIQPTGSHKSLFSADERIACRSPTEEEITYVHDHDEVQIPFLQVKWMGLNGNELVCNPYQQLLHLKETILSYLNSPDYDEELKKGFRKDLSEVEKEIYKTKSETAEMLSETSEFTKSIRYHRRTMNSSQQEVSPTCRSPKRDEQEYLNTHKELILPYMQVKWMGLSGTIPVCPPYENGLKIKAGILSRLNSDTVTAETKHKLERLLVNVELLIESSKSNKDNFECTLYFAHEPTYAIEPTATTLEQTCEVVR